jgi:hypothetical protein
VIQAICKTAELILCASSGCLYYSAGGGRSDAADSCDRCGARFSNTAQAGPILDKLKTCLTVEDMTKERLDCYDAVVPPEPKAKPPVAKIVTDCRYLKEEDERLICFNRFVEQPVLRSSPSHILPHNTAPVVTPLVTYTHRGRGGCGSRGGAGYRLPNGRCASRRR